MDRCELGKREKKSGILSNEIDRSAEVCSNASDKLVTNIKNIMPEEEKLYDLAEFFKVFGDTTRVKIICVLFESEMCVCDIAEVLNMTQSAVSHQLRVLKNSRLAKFRKEGKSVYYSLDDDHVRNIFKQGFDHINHKH